MSNYSSGARLAGTNEVGDEAGTGNDFGEGPAGLAVALFLEEAMPVRLRI